MLKKLILENWKSFRYAELPIDPLTVLIGTNASGKTNAIEAFTFLKRIANGEKIDHALNSESEIPSIRGGSDWAILRHREKFSLEILIQGVDEEIEYSYSITVEINPVIQILDEQLTKISLDKGSEADPKQIKLFQASSNSSQTHRTVSLYDEETPILDFVGSQSVLSLLSTFYFHVRNLSNTQENQINEGVDRVLESLQNVFIFDPIPQKMRAFSSLSTEILSDASNIAGVLAALPNGKKVFVESTLSSYVSYLPERDIRRVWAEKVGRQDKDALLYCEESWASDEPPMEVDARKMSDGTLRFIAIVTALLTRPEGSQLVIEEVDNGLHPSRAELLLKMLKELGAKRKIDILVTTHNPALLDALGLKMVPFVVVAHRDAQTGESKLTSLDDIRHLPKLLASGSMGDLATQGTLEKVLSHSDSVSQ
jgi:predicted ATPase